MRFSFENGPSADLADDSVWILVEKDGRNMTTPQTLEWAAVELVVIMRSHIVVTKKQRIFMRRKKQSMQSVYRVCAYAGISVVFICSVVCRGSCILTKPPESLASSRDASTNQTGWLCK